MFTVLYSIYGRSVCLACFPFLFLVCPFSEGKREGWTERVGGWVVEMCLFGGGGVRARALVCMYWNDATSSSHRRRYISDSTWLLGNIINRNDWNLF